jgi:quercetin dioxygenase-like cupin family protein
MRRSTAGFWLISLLILGLLVGPPAVTAQDATPAGAPEGEGVTFVPIGFAEGVDLPSPASLLAVQVTLEPGAVSPFTEDDPTSGMLIVESGEITIRVEAEWTVTRAGSMAAEVMAVGDETTLGAGDVAYVPGSVAGELRNDGEQEATGLIFLIVPGDSLGG